ncbi:MAG TPA: hypothetical protein VKQ06_11240 [Gammaproteobacteria bacterium]|nr:hypothetical protein [Gammaproteobacteria bacterium]
MRVLRTRRWHALLVVVVLGFFALTLHTSIHSQQDQQSCELCGGHFNPSHAIASSGEVLVFVSGIAPLESTIPEIPASRPFAFYRQRAPPHLN